MGTSVALCKVMRYRKNRQISVSQLKQKRTAAESKRGISAYHMVHETSNCEQVGAVFITESA